MNSYWGKVLLVLLFFSVEALSWNGHLVLEDTFKYNYLRNDLWEHDDHCVGKGPGSDTLECFQRGGNIEVTNGTLVIKARTDILDERKDTPYTSGKIRTHGPGFSYGTFVVRARLPKGKHLLPSIWIQPINQDDDVCRYEEIDLVELRGQRPSTLIYSAYYGRSYKLSNVRKYEKVFRGVDFSQEFHEFAVRWMPTRLQWFMDGRKVYELTTHFKTDWAHKEKARRPCDYTRNSVHPLFGQESHLVISLGVGGVSFPTAKYGDLTRDEALKWPKATMEIDYVRIYQD